MKFLMDVVLKILNKVDRKFKYSEKEKLIKVYVKML